MLHPAYLVPLSFGAGLAAGFARFPGTDPWLFGTLLLVVAAWRRGPAALAALLVLLGAAAAELASADEARSCRAALPEARLALTVRLREPSPPEGGVVEAEPLGAGCIGTLRLRWSARSAHPAGVTLSLTGRWRRQEPWGGRARGTLAVESARVVAASPSLGDQLRTTIAERAGRLFGTRAGMVEALVTGRRGGIDRDLQDRFAESGLVHLLSISGFHVGLVTAWVGLLLRAAGQPPVRALLVASGASTLYVAFLGFPAPALRALALAWALAVARARQRVLRPHALLATTCLVVLLADPWALLDLGAWLSATSLWGVTVATRWSDRAIGTGWLVRTAAGSVGALAATAPITAALLGTVAPVGVALNFAAIPLAAVAVPGVLAALLADGLLPPLAQAFAAGSGLLLHGLEALATWGAAVPYGHLVLAAEPRSAAPWVALLVLALWVVHGRATAARAVLRAGWAIGVVLWAALLGARVPDGAADGTLALHFLDVGQGDATAIRTPRGRWLLVDAGPADARLDMGRRVVAPFLARHGVRRLDALLLSHAHQDHVGGAAAVLERLPPTTVLEPARLVDEPGYGAFLAEVQAGGDRWLPARDGQQFTIDSVRFTVLHPDTAWAGWGTDLNEDSLVLLVEYGAFRALLAGDAGLPAEGRLAGRVGDVDALKAGHHGSRSATGDAWLDELRPEHVILSLAARNRYGHPHAEVLDRLHARGLVPWRTDRHGTITLTSDGRTSTVTPTR
ncbi:MAG: DNA internalization-related competence protein ComEC/Rec2 [Gemmatimonadales bacterium]|nr:DNA internalization-related competence protein ComEC/Rec2 [Gemmatimonadales bacterium]